MTRSLVIAALLALLAGGAYGVHEVTQHHWSAFKARYPNANEQFWNPVLSWQNKYEGGKVENGPAYPGSTTVFVFLTDAKHLSGTLHASFLVLGSFAMLWGGASLFNRLFPSPSPPRWQKWALWAALFAAVVALRAIGFTLVYSVWF